MNDLETRLDREPTLHQDDDPLRVVYLDEAMVVIDKPSGVMTHKSRLAEDDEPSAMERLRDQLNEWVYPVHRLDRATSGLLVFSRHQECARALHESLRSGLVEKTYWAVTRGHGPTNQFIDRPLKEKRDRVTDKKAVRDKPPQEAQTSVRTLAHCTLPIPLGRYQSARFSLVEAQPKTGRRHQLRRHLAGINYPIIGDTTHGRGEQNRFFRTHFECYRLLLAAVKITIPHPQTGHVLHLEAPLSGIMSHVCQSLFLEECRQDSVSASEEESNASTLTWLTKPGEELHLFAADHA